MATRSINAQIVIGADVSGALGELRSLSGGIASSVKALAGLFLVNEIKQGTAALVAARVEVDRIRASLKFSAGEENVNQELAFIRETAHTLGLQLDVTAHSWQSFSAAARGTRLEGEGARLVFTSVAQAASVLGLSAENTNGVLLALQQMLSKGKLSAEELRGQMGERLPGAFAIAARAMGVTESQLNDLLEQGKILSEDFLPKFARQLEQEFAGSLSGASNTASANLNRMSNALSDFKQELAQTAAVDSAIKGIGALGKTVQEFANSLREAREQNKSFFGRLISPLLLTKDDQNKKLQEYIDENNKIIEKAQRTKNIYDRSDAATAAADNKRFQAIIDRNKAGVKAEQEGLKISNARADFRKGEIRSEQQLQKVRSEALSELNKLEASAMKDEAKRQKEREDFVQKNRGFLTEAEVDRGLAAIDSKYAKSADVRIAAMRKVFDATAELTADAIERERQALEERNQAGEVSLREYYQTRAALEDEGFNNTRAQLERERALVRSTIAENVSRLASASGLDPNGRERFQDAINGLKTQEARLDAQIVASERDKADAAERRVREQSRSLELLNSEILLTRNRIARDSGQALSRAAIEAEFRSANQAELSRLTGEGFGQMAEDRVKSAVDAAEFAQLERAASQAFQRMRVEEEAARIELDQGAISIEAYEARLNSLHSQGVGTLGDLVTQLRALSTGNTDAEIKVRQLVNQIQELRTPVNELADAARSNAASGFTQLFDDIQTRTKSTAATLKDFVRSLADSMRQLINQRLGQKLADSLFGNKAGGTSGSSSSGWIGTAANFVASMFHTGGVVGQSGGMRRSVNPLMFVGAPRYHNGGIAGLKPNEVPAILEKGERVLTAAEQRAGGLGPINVSVYQDGRGNDVQASSRAGMELGRMIEDTVNQYLIKQMRPGGILQNSRG